MATTTLADLKTAATPPTRSSVTRSPASSRRAPKSSRRQRGAAPGDRRRGQRPARFGRLEGAVFGDDGDEGLIVTVGRIDRRCGALVIEEDGPDGKPVITARPARLGLDAKFVIGLLVTLITAGVVPILVAHA
jgi:hypothetical protein